MKMMHHAAAAFMCGFLWSFAPAAVAQVPKDRLDQAARGGYFNGGLAALRNNGVVIDRGGLISLASPIPGESA